MPKTKLHARDIAPVFGLHELAFLKHIAAFRILIARPVILVMFLLFSASAYSQNIANVASRSTTNVAFYLNIPEDIANENREVLNALSYELFEYLEPFVTRGGKLKLFNISDADYVDRDMAKSFSLSKKKLSSWLAINQNKDYLANHNIHYVIAGKFEYLGDRLVLQWNLVRVGTGGEYFVQYAIGKRHPGELDLSEYLNSPQKTLPTIAQQLLVYAETRFPEFSQTNVVFCSCFKISSGNVEEQIELDQLHDSLPVTLALLLDEPFRQNRNIEIYGPRDLTHVERDCKDENSMKNYAIRRYMPDIFINGLIYGDAKEDSIKVYISVRKSRVDERSYGSEEDERSKEYKRLIQKLAIHVDQNWDDIISDISHNE
jgi:hypothetical protein